MTPDELLDALRQLHHEQAHKVLAEWHRSLPFGDYIVDRWKRAASLNFGQGASIYDNALVLGQVSVGERTWIGPFTVLDGSGGLEIGAFCSISAGVQIYTHDTVAWALSGGLAQAEKASVSIGNRCYLGPNVIVSKGVRIGDGCVIGANSFVNSDIPDGSRAWGTPATVKGTS